MRPVFPTLILETVFCIAYLSPLTFYHRQGGWVVPSTHCLGISWTDLQIHKVYFPLFKLPQVIVLPNFLHTYKTRFTFLQLCVMIFILFIHPHNSLLEALTLEDLEVLETVCLMPL